MEDSNPPKIKIQKVIHNKYTIAQKIAVIYEMEKISLHSVSGKYGIDRKSIREWMAQKEDLINQEKKNKKYIVTKNAGYSSGSYTFE